MFGMTRTIFRVGVIGALATGGLVLIAGHERVSALCSQVTGHINDHIDKAITDPVALRAQLRDLEATYPRRISQVRSDLGEVKGQMAQLTRESAVSQRVVDMTARDLETLQTLVAQAEQARASIQNVSLGNDEPRRVEIVFEDQHFTVEQAYQKTAEVNNTRTAYSTRCADIQRDMGYLAKQEDRLTSLLNKLESERSDFQVQLWQLDRQVDSIARNDRMIEILSKRQAAIEEQSRYKAGSLDHLQTKVSDIRAKQEAELAALAGSEERSNYEQKAKMDLDAKAAQQSLKDAAKASNAKANHKSEVIEIRPVTGTSTSPVKPTTPASTVNASPVN